MRAWEGGPRRVSAGAFEVGAVLGLVTLVVTLLVGWLRGTLEVYAPTVQPYETEVER